MVDPMHALDLNLLQNHCRNMFQIDIKHPGGNGYTKVTSHKEMCITSKEHFQLLKKCMEIIEANLPDLQEALLDHPQCVLYTICIDNQILGDGHRVIMGTKWVLAKQGRSNLSTFDPMKRLIWLWFRVSFVILWI